MNFLANSAAKVFEFWHRFISPGLAKACRHEPSCSLYGAEALRSRGLLVGLGLTAWRLMRCNPWGSHGYDPVPKRPS